VTAAGTERTANVVAAFDEAASRYDSNGRGHAGPVASRLVQLAFPRTVATDSGKRAEISEDAR
jgi:hypothetical protein